MLSMMDQLKLSEKDVSFHNFIKANLDYCSDFRRKRNIYARCGFFSSVNFRDRNNSFQQTFLHPIEDVDFLSSNLNRYFTSADFL